MQVQSHSSPTRSGGRVARVFFFFAACLGFLTLLSWNVPRVDAAPQIPRHTHPLLGIEPVQTFVVTNTADTGISGPAPEGTLRWAMNQANASAGFDLIYFDLPGSGVQTIRVKDWLPDLTDNAGVMIDGTLSDDRIEIDTSKQNIYHFGLALYSDNNVIKGLVINGTPGGSAAIGTGYGGSYNLIIGNFLGTNAAGTNSKSAWEGIKLGKGSHDNLIGGTNGLTPGGRCTGDCNLISGNRAHGIVIDHADNNKVIGNFIGTDVTGTYPIPNAQDGILLANSSNNVIGGATPEERNVISGNDLINIEIGQTDTPTRGNLFIGNYIGPNSAGNAPVGGNAVGIVLGLGASGNTFDSNVISGNGSMGILVFKKANGNHIVRNLVGVAADGQSKLRNNGIGINIQTNNNEIAENVIANHPSDGVRVKSGTGNVLRANSVYGNAKLGINIAVDGFTPNDAGDKDNGPNTLQNFPMLKSASAANGTLTIQGALNSVPMAQFTVEFFHNAVCNNTYNHNEGQGKTYLGAVQVKTNKKGNVKLNVTLQTDLSSGYIVSTATDAAGNTSEFSPCVAVNGAP